MITAIAASKRTSPKLLFPAELISAIYFILPDPSDRQQAS
jgi:hypothetical protein